MRGRYHGQGRVRTAVSSDVRALVVVLVLAAASPVAADASVPAASGGGTREAACKAQMERARWQLEDQRGFTKAQVRVDRGWNPGTAARDDWEVVVTAEAPGVRRAIELRAMVGIANSGQWSFYPRGRWFDNARMWRQTFRVERYPAGDHEIAAIIIADGVPRRMALAFAGVMRPAIDDCLAMPR
jgi:hypothetical protein